MSFTKKDLLDAGLPVVETDGENHASFERSLTSEEWQIFCDIRDGATYKEKRAREYPPLADFADAFYWMQKGDPSKMEAYLAACDVVKQEYSKE